MDKEENREGFLEVMEEKRIGDILRVGSNVIIPVIKIFIAFCGKETVNGGYFSVAPYALIVVDSEGERVLSLSGEEVKMEDIVKEVPGLKEKIREIK